MSDQAQGRVVVAGSVNLDYVITSPRHPQLGETLIGWHVAEFPGGKGANQATASARAGAPTLLLGTIGDDDAGATLREFLRRAGVDVSQLREVEGPTGKAFVTVAEDDNAVIVIPGANARTSPAQVDAARLRPSDVLVSQFEISNDTVVRFFAHGKAIGARTLLNPSPTRLAPAELWALADLIVVNEIEFEWLRHTANFAHGGGPTEFGPAVLRRDGQAIVMTLGARGCIVVDGAGVTAIGGHTVTVTDTTGAGDCFLGNLAAQLAAGRDLRTAAVTANVAAAICVQRMGAAASMPLLAETMAARSER